MKTGPYNPMVGLSNRRFIIMFLRHIELCLNLRKSFDKIRDRKAGKLVDYFYNIDIFMLCFLQIATYSSALKI